MIRNVLICAILALTFGLFPKAAHAQNAQCTLLTGPNFGQIVPVTINPAPPPNAPCQVGSDTGYISKTSSGVSVSPDAICTIVASGHSLDIPYEAHPIPPLDAPCQIGSVTGYISATSAASTNASAQCTPFSGPNAGRTIPYSATPPPPLDAPCKIGKDVGYVSRTSAPDSNANSVCTVLPTAGSTVDAPYHGNPAPPLDASCQVGNLGGYVSKTNGPSGNANAQCTVVTPSFSQSTPGVGTAVPYFAAPAPALDASCSVGLDTGFVSSTARPGPAPNSVCTIVYNGASIQAPYYAQPAPPLKNPCEVGNGYRGTITSSNPAWSPGSKPFDLVWIINSDGTVQKSGYDRNGYPLNPLWFPQTKDPTNVSNNPNFANTCGVVAFSNDFSSCSSQNPQPDLYTGDLSSFGVCNQPDTVMNGHLNFYITTYTGDLWFDNWSSTAGCDPTNIETCGNDHDYNLSLLHGDNSGLTSAYDDEDICTAGGPACPPGGPLHLEFNSDESIDSWFGSTWWQNFRNIVEANPQNEFAPLAGSPAIVTGLLGIDGVHRGGYTELHPVYSMALHDASDDPDVWLTNQKSQVTVQQHWHFFIRNRGTEGTCSHEIWSWIPFRGGTDYYIQLPWAVLNGTPAASVKFVGGQAWPWSKGMSSPTYEVAQGKWIYLHFNLPVLPLAPLPSLPPVVPQGPGAYVSFASGFDGYMTLEYAFPAGVKSTAQERRRAASVPVRQAVSDEQEDWSRAFAKITDPNVKLQLQRAFELPPIVHFQTNPLTIAASVLPEATKQNPPGEDTLLRAQGTTDPLKAKVQAEITSAMRSVSTSQPKTRSQPAAFSGTWTAIQPTNRLLPQTLALTQNGSVVVFAGFELKLAGSTASATVPETCAAKFQKPGYKYTDAAGTTTLRLTLEDSRLVYENETTWQMPCDGHSVGTERQVGKYQRPP